jgi:hypothetical protein
MAVKPSETSAIQCFLSLKIWLPAAGAPRDMAFVPAYPSSLSNQTGRRIGVAVSRTALEFIGSLVQVLVALFLMKDSQHTRQLGRFKKNSRKTFWQ